MKSQNHYRLHNRNGSDCRLCIPDILTKIIYIFTIFLKTKKSNHLSKQSFHSSSSKTCVSCILFGDHRKLPTPSTYLPIIKFYKGKGGVYFPVSYAYFRLD